MSGAGRDAGACARCSREVEPSARFCRHCGALLGGRAAALEGGDARSPARLEGEHKNASVLVADLQGSTALSTRFDSEEWHRIIGGFFAILAEGVRRFGGTVSRFTGDGIVALFGAPLAQEDHAVRACRAALHARDGLWRYADELRRTHGLSFSARFGLHSGDVVAATLGGDPGVGYTAVGQTVSLAARLEQLAEPGKIFVSAATARLVTGYADLCDLGTFEIPGLAGATRVFELRDAGRDRAHIERARARGAARFVGRIQELERLEAALARALEGRGSVVQVIGEAGVGKSRLCDELRVRCRARGVRVVRSQVGAHLEAIPFATFIEDFRHYVGVSRQDDPAVARARVAEVLALVGEEVRDALPLAYAVLGLGEPSASHHRLDPAALESGLTRLTGALVRALADSGPAVVVVEDVHAIDAGTAAMLSVLVKLAPELPLLVVLTRRRHAAAQELDCGERIDLPPLPPDAATELVRDLLGPGADTAPLAQRIRARSRGNPFFIQEIVHALADAHVLEGERGAYRLVGAIDRVSLPVALQNVIAARIDRLASRDKALLQTAAVIGYSFPTHFLREVVELDESAFEQSIRRLLDAEFLQLGGAPPNARCAFHHPLLHEVAYTTQVADVRMRAHRRVAEALLARDPSRLDEDAALLSRHLELAGDVGAAAEWALRAAHFAEGRSASQAENAWARVRALAGARPAAPASRAMAVQARAGLLRVGARIGFADSDEPHRLFAEGEGLALELDEPSAMARLCSAYAEVCATGGELATATAMARRGLGLTPRFSDVDLTRRLQATFVLAEFLTGRFGAARRAVEGFLWVWPAPPGGRHLAHPGDCYLVLFHAMAGIDMGLVDEARQSIELVMREADALGAGEAACLAYAFSPVIAQIAGDDPGPCLRDAFAASARAEQVGSAFALTLARWGLGVAHRLNGDPTAAIEALGAALVSAREKRIGLQAEGGILAALAESHLDRGETEEGWRSAQRAVDVCLERGTRFFACLARLALARATLDRDAVAGAERVEDLLTAVDELIAAEGLRALEPAVHGLRAQLAALGGDLARAQLELAEAHRCCRAIGATGHAVRLEAMLDLGAVA